MAASKLWANHIIVADQGSTDSTFQKLQTTPGVIPVVNDSPKYDESYRQQLLLKEARKIEGKRILIGLDADEALSANCTATADWQRILQAKPGTVLRFRWVNILPGFKEAWIPPKFVSFGFVDDGTDHIGQQIHSPRVPNPQNAPALDLEEVVVLHFQFVAWDRMVSKHRWYQAWEWLNHPSKGALKIFRQYNHMFGSWDQSEIHPVKPEWLDGYSKAGVDFHALKGESVTWWDREIVQMLCEHGPELFRKVAIWEKDWNAVATAIDMQKPDLDDPRSPAERLFHYMLRKSQGHRSNWVVRAFEHFLRRIGW